MLYELLEALTSPQSRFFALKTFQFGPFTLSTANPAGTEILDIITINDPNDGAYLVAADFTARNVANANSGPSSLDELDDWLLVCRWNDSDLINKPSPIAVNVLQPYIKNHSSITFGASANKSDWVCGRIPIMAKVGPGGRVSIGVRKRAGGGVNNWTFDGIIYYSFFPYYQLPGRKIPGSVAG